MFGKLQFERSHDKKVSFFLTLAFKRNTTKKIVYQKGIINFNVDSNGNCD